MRSIAERANRPSSEPPGGQARQGHSDPPVRTRHCCRVCGLARGHSDSSDLGRILHFQLWAQPLQSTSTKMAGSSGLDRLGNRFSPHHCRVGRSSDVIASVDRPSYDRPRWRGYLYRLRLVYRSFVRPELDMPPAREHLTGRGISKSETTLARLLLRRLSALSLEDQRD